MNANSKCSQEGCNGLLVATRADAVGKGGGISVTWACNGCTDRRLHFSSTLVEGTRRECVATSAAVAFVIGGRIFRKYERVLGLGLGLNTLSSSSFNDIIKMMYGPVKDILDSQCASTKVDMKAIPPGELGSAITASLPLLKCYYFIILIGCKINVEGIDVTLGIDY